MIAPQQYLFPILRKFLKFCFPSDSPRMWSIWPLAHYVLHHVILPSYRLPSFPEVLIAYIIYTNFLPFHKPSAHFSSTNQFWGSSLLRTKGLLWDGAMLFRDTQLISSIWHSSGTKPARLAWYLHKASMTKSNSISFCPRPWTLKGWIFRDSQKDTKIWFQTCWGVTLSISIQKKRFQSHWGSMRPLFPSFPGCLWDFSTEILPERSSPWVSANHTCFTAISLRNVLCLKLSFLGSDTSPLLHGFLLEVKSLF